MGGSGAARTYEQGGYNHAAKERSTVGGARYRGRMASVQRVDLVWVYYRRTLARWQYHAEHISGEAHVRVGWLPDGRWWVDDTDQRTGWIFTGDDAEASARAQADEQLRAPRRLAGRWLATDPEPGSTEPAPPRPPGHEPTAAPDA